MHDKPSATTHRVLEAIEPFGQPTAILFTAGAIALCDARRRRGVVRLLGTALGSGLAADLLKLLLARVRPYHHELTGSVWSTFQNLLPGISAGSKFQSFPSAHTATATGFCLGLSALYPAGRWLFFPVAVLVALQRVEVGAHFLSDVCFGAVVGCGMAWFLYGRTGVARRLEAFEGTDHKAKSLGLTTPAVTKPRRAASATARPLRLPPRDLPQSVSVVIPVYNERESLVWLHAALRPVLDALEVECEMVFVDDGSNDGSALELAEMAVSDDRVRVVTLPANCGQAVALRAGIAQASGEAIVLMDADLQNDPADIPGMLHTFAQGFDLVHGWRRHRQDRYLDRRLPSLIANRLISWVTGYRVHDTGCTLKVLRQSLARSLPLFGGMHRYIPALAFALGARCVEIEARHHARRFGTSKYGLSRILHVLVELVVVKSLTIALARQRHADEAIGDAEGAHLPLRAADPARSRPARAG